MPGMAESRSSCYSKPGTMSQIFHTLNSPIMGGGVLGEVLLNKTVLKGQSDEFFHNSI
jgi:hypothetical protein